jgi:hypothetical protein
VKREKGRDTKGGFIRRILSTNGFILLQKVGWK